VSSRWLAGATGKLEAGPRIAGSRWCSHGTARLLVGDFNGDHRADLLCHDVETGHKWINYAEADGWVPDSRWNADLQWCFHEGALIVLGDYDGDGRTDMACLDRARYAWILRANRQGQFGADQWEGPGRRCSGVQAADVDGDGRDDILCVEGTGLSILYSRRDGSLGREPG
jgi:hypothetical protein